MNNSKQTRLDQLLHSIRAKWGRDAIAPLTQKRQPLPLATGFESLDTLLGLGGLPRGKLVEFCGVGTSGSQTLALHIAAAVQARYENVAYLDVGKTLDASFALGCGVRLDKLLRICPVDGKQALAIAHTLLDRAAVDLLIIDSLPELLRQPYGARLLTSALPQLLNPLARSQAVVIFLSSPVLGERITTQAAVRLLVERHAWVERFDDTIGYQLELAVLKNNFGRIGRQTTIDLIFNQQGDDSL